MDRQRYNAVLEDMLRHYVGTDQKNGDELLPAVNLAVNNSRNDSTGETPAFLMQGQHPLTPETIQTESSVPSARLCADQLQQTIRQVQDNLCKAQDRQKKYADTRRRDVKHTPKDMVLLSSKTLTFQTVGTRKVLPKYTGPLPIDRLIGSGAFKTSQDIPQTPCFPCVPY